jgi:hypothetical protein
MSDYLSRLVERSRGGVPQLQPVIAPIHAPSSPWLGDEVAESESSSARAVRTTTHDGTVTPPLKSPPLPAAQEERWSGDTITSQPAIHAHASEPPQKIAISGNDTAPATTPPRADDPLPVPATPRRPSNTPLPPSAAQKAPTAVRPQRIVRSAPAAAARQDHEPTTPPQTIRVTIGRVDVRAIMPAASTPAPRASQPKPQHQSLEDYLRTGSSGARR